MAIVLEQEATPTSVITAGTNPITAIEPWKFQPMVRISPETPPLSLQVLPSYSQKLKENIIRTEDNPTLPDMLRTDDPFTRNPNNPTLEPIPELRWANRAVYNPSVIEKDGKTVMIFRAKGDDGISRLGYAESTEGENFKVDINPVFEPENDLEKFGVEDPRITYLEDEDYYVMCYTALDGKCARQGIAISTDLKNWQRKGLVLPGFKEGLWNEKGFGNIDGSNEWSKSGAVLPKKIKISGKDRYYMLFGDTSIRGAYSDDLVNWTTISEPILDIREGYFDSGAIENGPPPLEIELENGNQAWLVFYHGIDSLAYSSTHPRKFRLGAALLDRNDPGIVLGRTELPLMAANTDEMNGSLDVTADPKIVYHWAKGLSYTPKAREPGKDLQLFFCCSSRRDANGKIILDYSTMDTRIHQASADLNDILGKISLESSPSNSLVRLNHIADSVLPGSKIAAFTYRDESYLLLKGERKLADTDIIKPFSIILNPMVLISPPPREKNIRDRLNYAVSSTLYHQHDHFIISKEMLLNHKKNRRNDGRDNKTGLMYAMQTAFNGFKYIREDQALKTLLKKDALPQNKISSDNFSYYPPEDESLDIYELALQSEQRFLESRRKKTRVIYGHGPIDDQSYFSSEEDINDHIRYMRHLSKDAAEKNKG